MTVYRVVGPSPYRENHPGEIFEATLDLAAERRALARGDIEVLERTTPSIQPGSYQLPDGWATPPQEERR